MRDRDPEVRQASAYVLAPAPSVSENQLLAFAASVLPEQPPERMLQSWWRRADPDCSVAAMHRATGAMAGLCVGRPSTWVIRGEALPAIAICDWYLAPEHSGRLLGRRLVRHFQAPDKLLYAYSLSDDAARYLSRLGWVGPYTSSLLALPLPRAARLAHLMVRRDQDLSLADYDVEAPSLPDSVGDQIDQVAGREVKERYAQMRRGREEWSWRLSVCGSRRYRFCVASRSGEPLGYVAARRTTPGSSRLLGKREAAIITDLVVPDDDPALTKALIARAVRFAGEIGALAALATTTVQTRRRCYAALGFLSSGLPIIGRPLARRAPQFMWLPQGPGQALTADTMALSFSDSDVDLNL